MTDEEKAEEYAKNKIKVFDKDSSYYFFHIKQAYLDGLAEGRKLQISHLLGVEKENAELKAQIEKMKNVGNCKHSMKCAEWNEKQSYLGLMKFCLNCKDWELAE